MVIGSANVVASMAMRLPSDRVDAAACVAPTAIIATATVREIVRRRTDAGITGAPFRTHDREPAVEGALLSDSARAFYAKLSSNARTKASERYEMPRASAA
jgi:hypothetical protein